MVRSAGAVSAPFLGGHKGAADIKSLYQSGICAGTVRTMPQVDKATFFSIVTWSFVIYIGGFLMLNSQQLFTFLASLKVWAKRAVQLFTAALGKRRQLAAALFFPLIAL